MLQRINTIALYAIPMAKSCFTPLPSPTIWMASITFLINPLHTNPYRKSLTLRETKTDKVDAHSTAMMLMSNVNLKSYSDTLYHNEELKSLTRYRFDKISDRAKLKPLSQSLYPYFAQSWRSSFLRYISILYVSY